MLSFEVLIVSVVSEGCVSCLDVYKRQTQAVADTLASVCVYTYPKRSMRGPLDSADSLIHCRNGRELNVCIAELNEHVRAYNSKNDKDKDVKFGVFSTVARSIVTRLNQAPDCPEELLQLADGCFASCTGCASSQKQKESLMVLTYSYMKKLVALKRFKEALQHGQQLLASLVAREDELASSSTVQELKLGAALNVIICSSRLNESSLLKADNVSTAATFALTVIRSQGDKAAQHAVAVTRSLLEFAMVYAAEAAESSAQRSMDSAVNLTKLLRQAWMAASMTKHNDMLQQVASQIFSTLPPAMKHCTMVAMLQAARVRVSTSTGMGNDAEGCLSEGEVLSGLRALMSAARSDTTTAAACVRGLISLHQHTALCLEACTLLLVLASKSAFNLQAPDFEAITRTVGAVIEQRHTPTGQEQQIDDLAGQLSGVYLVDVPAGKRVTKQRSGKKTADAPTAVLPKTTGYTQPKVGVWCLQQLVKSSPKGQGLEQAYLAVLVSYLPDITAQLQAPNCAILSESVPQALALAAKLTAQLDISSCKSQLYVQLQTLVSSCQQILALPQLTHHLLQCLSDPLTPHEDTGVVAWSCPFSSRELQWLSWKLYEAAVRSTGRDTGVSDFGSHWATPALLLLGWQCACACVAKACHSEQQHESISKAEAMRDMLQHAQAYLSHVWRSVKQLEGDQTASGMSSPSARRSPQQQWRCQHNQMQDAMLMTVSAAAQLIEQLQESDGALEHLFSKVLGLYGKVRCKTAGHTSTANLLASNTSNSKRGRKQCTKTIVPADDQQIHITQYVSVLQLLFQGHVGQTWRVPVDVVFWAEYSALLRAASDVRLPSKATATAMTALVQELTACKTPPGWDTADFDATRQLLIGLAMSCTPYSCDEQRCKHGSIEAASAALSAASSQFLEMLGSAGVGASGTAANSTNRVKQNKQQKCRKQVEQQVCEVQAVTSEAAEALAGSHGCGTAARVLAHAALANCLLGLTKVAALMHRTGEHQPPSDDDAGDLGTTEQQVEHVEEGTTRDSMSLSADAELLEEVRQHCQLSCQLYQLLLQQQKAISCSLLSFVRFPLEAAAAATEAWHIAGLQGWSSCQHGYQQLLQCLLPILPAQGRPQLEQIQQLMPAPALTLGWLSWLLAPQLPLEHSDTSSSRVRRLPDIGGKCSTARKAEAIEVDDNFSNPNLCTCQLEAIQQLPLIAGQQQEQQEAHMSDSCIAVDLQQSRFHLAAGQAAIVVGNIVTAAVSAEAAIQLSKAVIHELSSSSGSTSSLHQLQGKHAHDAGLRWHAVGLYMSALWQLSGVLQLSGNPDDAIRVLKELARVSSACFCCFFSVLATARISTIYSRLGSTEKAAAASADALKLHSQLHLQQEQTANADVLRAVLTAAMAEAQSACLTSDKQYQQAEQQLVAALTALHESVQTAMPSKVQNSRSTGGQQPPDMLLWTARDRQAQLQLHLAHLTMLTSGHTAAVQQLTEAVQQLEVDVGLGCSRCQQTAWPMALASLRLQLLLWTAPNSVSPQVEQSLQLVGFVSSSTHSNLQAEFAHVASCSTAEHLITPAPKTKTTRGRKGSKTSKKEVSDSSTEYGKTTATEHAAAWLADVLSLLPACGSNVLLLKEVCSHLGVVLQSYGNVHGAAMMLQLSLGLSVVQQQLLTVSSKMSRAQQRSHPSAMQNTGDAAQRDDKGDALQQLRQHLDVMPLLNELAAAAHNSPLSKQESRLAGILSMIDNVAKKWLHQQLSNLPLGAVACSISVAHPQARSDDSTHSPYLLPATAALHLQANLPKADAGNGLLVCRMVPTAAGACYDAEDAKQQQWPLMVVLRPTGAGSVEGLLSELTSILSDSSASMQADADLGSGAPVAVKWWKQRLALDERMASLLRQLDQEWLGPWRCVVMQPGQLQTERAAAEAAQEFVTEHFEFVFEDAPRRLLSQLVAVLLVHLKSCSTTELRTAMRDLCQLTQQRVDGLHINKLVAGLTDMHAQLQTAASASEMSKDNSSSIHAPIASTVDIAAASPAYTTPAAPKVSSRLGLMQSSAKKAPRSRLKAMQHKSITADAGADDETCSSLAGLMVAKLKLAEDAEQDDARDTETDHTAAQPATALPSTRHKAKAPATTRRVRFAQEDSTAGDVGVTESGVSAHHLVPPPSLARHAVRRSRLRVPPDGRHSSSGTSAPEPTDQAPAIKTDVAEEMQVVANTPAVRKSQSRSRLSSSISTLRGSDAVPQQHGHAEAYMPSVLLMLDGAVQQLPWESCAGLKHQNIYRCPSLAAAAATAIRLRSTAQADVDGTRQTAAGGVPAAGQALRLSSGFFLLNPDGDLQATQNTFEDLLQHQLKLQGISGRRPSSSELVNALQQHDLFLYFGHGGGEQYVPLAALKRLNRCSASLLMGCSSGRLKQAGVFEPSGAIWGYLTAGCPSAVANLWDVTDRDIDRFAQAVLQQWAGGSGLGSAMQGDDGGNRSTADGSSKRVEATGSSSVIGNKGLEGVQMCAAVAAARQACRLPHLIGSAAVCYGLPMSVASTKYHV